MRSAVEATHGPEVLGRRWLRRALRLAGYTEPVLASTIDGVGTRGPRRQRDGGVSIL